jgi:phage protein U
MTEVLMMLGDFAFHLRTAAYEELSRSSSYRWVAQDRVGRRPAQQFLGPGAGQVTLSGEILPHFNGGFDQMDRIRTLAAQGKPLLMVDGRGNVWGDWVISQVDETGREHYSDGAPRSISFSITLVEYGGDLGGVSRFGAALSVLTTLARLL